MTNKPMVLLILDGWGHRQAQVGNAIAQAHTPHWDKLMHCPHTLLSGSGPDVGLPANQMGNSEVGHLTIGAGRVIYQDLSRITQAIHSGEFFKNTALTKAFAKAHHHQKAIHIMGLLSDGGIHSHQDHLFASIAMARKHSKGPLHVHAFLDGRDTAPQSAAQFLEKLTPVLNTHQATLASICGRYYAMDRDQRFERTQLAYQAIVQGQAPFYATCALSALKQAYERGETDEFVKPTCIHPTTMQPDDTVIYMNFRADRARALTYALTQADFNGFIREYFALNFVSLTEYDKQLSLPVAFPPQSHKNVLAEYLQNLHLTQLHLAETEKYAHVTFFFNGGVEQPFQGEQRILIPSPRVETYDLQPEMSAFEMTEQLVKHIHHSSFDFIVCNYANADMVGHTGNYLATIKAIETLDSCLGKVMEALKIRQGQALITADHGNAEYMFDASGIHTAHTTALVPLVYVGKRQIQLRTGTLSDIAPTLLQLMELTPPPEMTGQSLIVP